jgi:hypothetical protein
MSESVCPEVSDQDLPAFYDFLELTLMLLSNCCLKDTCDFRPS